MYKTPIITVSGRCLDLASTLVGLRLGFVEMNLNAWTPVGILLGFALVPLCFLVSEWGAKRIRLGVSVVIVVSFCTWVGFAWNLAHFLLWIR
jgi:hypothetical protein